MTSFMKSIRRLEAKFDRKAERFVFHHQYFGFFRYVFNNADFDFGNSSSNHNADCPAYSIFIWLDVIFIQN